jgi:phosphoribosylanthranilate isomerase
MTMTMVKICGIKTLKDALTAVELGADMLGFNFYPQSPRYVTPQVCAQISQRVSDQAPHVILVGVFVNVSAAEILSILNTCGLHLAQLSGDEPPETLEFLGERAFKALRTTTEADLQTALLHYPPRPQPPACLLDAAVSGQYGGTGKQANWELASQVAHRVPILLAGGLNPENVAVAVQQVRPWGVDVASGVESEPGQKDPHRLKAFIQQVRAAQNSFNEHFEVPKSSGTGKNAQA